MRLLDSAHGRIISPDQLGEFLVPPERHNWVDRVASIAKREWPEYAHFLERSDGDRSRADWFYALTCAARDFTAEEIAAKLQEVSEKAKDSGQGKYADRTARRAAESLRTRVRP